MGDIVSDGLLAQFSVWLVVEILVKLADEFADEKSDMLVVLSLGELDELVVFITGVRSKAISILSTASPIRIPLNELYPQKHN